MRSNQQLRLLYVASVPIHLHTFFRNYARHFRAKGWVVDAAASNVVKWEPSLHPDFDHLVNVDFIRNPFWEPLKLISRIHKVLQAIRVLAKNYDLIHVNTPMAAFLTRLALRKTAARPKIIYTAHGFHFFRGNSWWKNLLFRTLEKTASRWTDWLLVVNAEDYNAAVSFQTLPSSRITQIPEVGIDLAKFVKLPYNLKTELGLATTDKVITMVGELIPRKRQRDAIQALQSLPENYKLILVGNGKESDKLKEFVGQLHLTHRVFFLGFRHDVNAIVGNSDVLVLPSSQEGLPICVLEAMSLGTPTIVSDIRGSRDLVAAHCGYVFPVGNTQELATRIQTVLQADNSTIIKNASAKIKGYAIEQVLKIHEDVYATLLKPVKSSQA